MRKQGGGGGRDVVEERQAISVCPLKLVLWLFSVRSLSRDTLGIWLWKASQLPQTCDIQTSLSTDAVTCEQDTAAQIYTKQYMAKVTIFFLLLFLRMVGTSNSSWVQDNKNRGNGADAHTLKFTSFQKRTDATFQPTRASSGC